MSEPRTDSDGDSISDSTDICANDYAPVQGDYDGNCINSRFTERVSTHFPGVANV